MSAPARPRTDLLLELADDELILGWRNSEWTGIAPFLEEDVAFSSIAQNEIGHARALYEIVARSSVPRRRARVRPAARQYRSAPLVQLRRLDWAGRSRVTGSTRRPTRSGSRRCRVRRPELAGSRRRSPARRSTTACTPRCGSTACSPPTRAGARLDAALEGLWPYGLGVLDEGQRPELRAGSRRGSAEPARRRPGGSRPARAGARGAARRDDLRPPVGSCGSTLVTPTATALSERVWDALARIPDPEIPVISIVDLGVVDDGASRTARPRRAHPDVPRLPGARRDAGRMEEAIRGSAPSPTSRSC